jgi:hypothetical protein
MTSIPPPRLESGQRLARDEFDRRFDATPGLKKAELINGLVHVALPAPWTTVAAPRAELLTWLGVYHAATPGIEAGAHAHVRLDDCNEPQPDGALIVLPSHGGQARISADGYLEGGPELVAEIADGAFELKRTVYQSHGVREYVVWRVLDKVIDWFVLRGGEFERLAADRAGWYRSEVFPGLWLDPAALIAGHLRTVFDVVRQGLASPEHAAFVAHLSQQASQGGNP